MREFVREKISLGFSIKILMIITCKLISKLRKSIIIMTIIGIIVAVVVISIITVIISSNILSRLK